MNINEDKLFKKLMRGARQRVARTAGISEDAVDKVRKGYWINVEVINAWQAEEDKAKEQIKLLVEAGKVELKKFA